MNQQLILASASPRRKELLEQIGLQFQIIPSDAEETEQAGETPQQHVMRLSHDKARAVADREGVEGRWILGSDTIVVHQNQILGKPADPHQAAQMLHQLSGHEHQVLSGIALIDRETGQEHTEAVATRVRFRHLTAAEIERYIASGEPMDKAGSYAIQGLGVCFIASIEGSYSNVVGLPLCRLTQIFKQFGVPMPI